MAYILALILLCLTGFAHAVDPIPYNMPADVAGYVKQPDGTYSRAVPRGGSRSASGSTITSKEIVPYQDQKGRSHNFEVQRSANVDKFNNRLGKSVVSVAKAFGPLSVALALADAVCNLSDICNIDGEWMIPATLDPNDYPTTTPIQSYCTGGFCSGQYDTRAPTPSESCRIAAEDIKLWGNNRTGTAISSNQCEVRNATTNDYLFTSSISLSPSSPHVFQFRRPVRID